MPPLKLPEKLLVQLLNLCTKRSPFSSPEGELYTQIEGVAMGSPLGPSFANFYMGYLEHQTFIANTNITKPTIYARYIDDIFILTENEDQIIKLKQAFEENSVLKFTYELNINNKLPFLCIS